MEWLFLWGRLLNRRPRQRAATLAPTGPPKAGLPIIRGRPDTRSLGGGAGIGSPWGNQALGGQGLEMLLRALAAPASVTDHGQKNARHGGRRFS